MCTVTCRYRSTKKNYNVHRLVATAFDRPRSPGHPIRDYSGQPWSRAYANSGENLTTFGARGNN